MKILSGWRDYYDFVAHQYGGGDPKVIYERDFVVPDRDVTDLGFKHEETKSIHHYDAPDIPGSMQITHTAIGKELRHEFRALVVMDRVFLLERYGDIGELGGISEVRKDWHVTSRQVFDLPYGGYFALLRDGEELGQNASIYERRKMSELLKDKSNLRYLVKQGERSTKALKLCELVGAPVFLVDGRRSPCVMGRTPKLSSLGLAAYIEPQQLYQELAMFVGNVLKPVEQPTSNMSNIEKVVSHGFDKKVSFRHRK